MDKFDLVGGEKWEQALTRAVRRSDFFLFCASRHSVNKRGAIQREIKEALKVWEEKLEDDIFFIPVRLEPCEVPQNISVFHWIDFFEPDGLRRIERSINEGLARLHGYEDVGEIAVVGRSMSAEVEGCYHVEVHYPEFRPSFVPDLAAMNASLSSFALRMGTRFKKHAAILSPEERRQVAPASLLTTDSLDLSYKVEHLGEEIVSLRFRQVVYFAGAAHPNSLTRTFNYRRHPFSELDLDDVLRADGHPLREVSDYCISVLLRENREKYGDKLDEKWTREGANVKNGNFSRFLLTPAGVRFIFDPYEVGSYAEGQREVLIPMDIAVAMLDPEIQGLLQAPSQSVPLE